MCACCPGSRTKSSTALHELELRHELGGEPPVTVVDQTNLSLEAGQLSFLCRRAVAERRSLGEQALNRAGRSEQQKFDVLIGVRWLDLGA